MLEIDGVHAFYGASHILHGVTLSVGRSEVVALLGRNGAGKSTTLKCAMGIVPAKSGRVRLLGRDITGLPPYRIARLGIAYVPEERRIFPDLTVRENLEVARRGTSSAWDVNRVYDVFPPLAALDGRLGEQLSGGEQQMLAIGRALMQSPALILLDEPSEGLAPVVVERLGDSLQRLKESGLTILLAEQNLVFVRDLADRAYVIDKGVVVHEGTIEEVWNDEEISTRFLAV